MYKPEEPKNVVQGELFEAPEQQQSETAEADPETERFANEWKHGVELTDEEIALLEGKDEYYKGHN